MLQHSSHEFIDVTGEDLESYFTQCFPQTIKYHLSPQHAEYVKFEPREICINNETFQFHSIIMSGTHCLNYTPRMNCSTHSETPSQDTLHTHFIYESHQVHHSSSNSFQESYDDHCQFDDIIESWLEESYTASFPMNNNHPITVNSSYILSLTASFSPIDL
jgi:hypothetical protein